MGICVVNPPPPQIQTEQDRAGWTETSCGTWCFQSKMTFRVGNLGRGRIILIHMQGISRQDSALLNLPVWQLTFLYIYTHTHRNRSQILKLIKHLVKMSDDSFPRTSLRPLVTPGERLKLSPVRQEIWKSSAKWLLKLSGGSEPCRPFSGLVYQAAPSPLCELHSLIGVLRVH